MPHFKTKELAKTPTQIFERRADEDKANGTILNGLVERSSASRKNYISTSGFDKPRRKRLGINPFSQMNASRRKGFSNAF